MDDIALHLEVRESYCIFRRSYNCHLTPSTIVEKQAESVWLNKTDLSPSKFLVHLSPCEQKPRRGSPPVAPLPQAASTGAFAAGLEIIMSLVFCECCKPIML